MPLCVNADDLGISIERDLGILAAWSDRLISSASFMVNGPSAATAAQQAYQTGLAGVLGLHLNLTEFSPLTGAATTLCAGAEGDADRRAWRLDPGAAVQRGKHGLRTALRSGDVSLDDVAREADAQINEFSRVFGRVPRFLDGHQHIHVVPEVTAVLAKLMAQYGIAYTRIPDESLDQCPWVDPDGQRRRFLSQVVQDSRKARLVYAQHGVRSPDAFVGLSVMGGDLTLSRARAIVQAWAYDQPQRVCEWMVHPGFPDYHDIGDDFNKSIDRLHELRILNQAVRGVPLVSYHDLPSPDLTPCEEQPQS